VLVIARERSDLPFHYIIWRPAVKSRARRGRRHDQLRDRERSVAICLSITLFGDLRSNPVRGEDAGTINYVIARERSDLPFHYIIWRPAVKSRARRGRRHDQLRDRERSVAICLWPLPTILIADCIDFFRLFSR